MSSPSASSPRLALLSLALLAACGGGDGDDDGPGADGGDVVDARDDADACASGCEPRAGSTLSLELVTAELDGPVLVTAAPGDPRLFAVEQDGRIRIIEDGQVQAGSFLDISGEVTAQGEQGLLGLAFHPDYASN